MLYYKVEINFMRYLYEQGYKNIRKWSNRWFTTR